MQKVTAFLEKYVQWLVLVFAVLYVGYTVYYYVVIPPLTVALAPGVIAKPGDVDPRIKTTQADPLDKEIHDKTVKAPAVKDVLSEFFDRLDEKRIELADMTVNWDAQHVLFGTGVSSGPKVAGPKIIGLPQLPPAEFKAMSTSRTVLAAGNADIAYVSMLFKINNAQLFADVNAAFGGGPPNIFQTPEFAEVVLLREEQTPAGGWGPAKVIAPLAINNVQPCPPDNAKMDVKLKYRVWMDNNQQAIAHPKFFDIASGAPAWTAPGAAALAPGAQPLQPGAAAIAPQPLNPLRPAAVAVGAPGAFNGLAPAVMVEDPSILVHDTTIEEGKTYRYAVSYKLYNPLFTAKAWAAPAVANALTIPGPNPLAPGGDALAWSGTVQVEPSVYVFVTKIRHFSGQADFDVFEWKGGHWNPSKSKKLEAGDPIDGNGGKANPHYTVVDVRKDPGDKKEPTYVLLLNDRGELEPRTVDDDGANPKYATLKQQAGAAALAR